jgi:hypothetical protein
LLNGLCLNPENSQAITISLHPFSTAKIPPVALNGSVVPYCEKVKDLGLLQAYIEAHGGNIGVVAQQEFFFEFAAKCSE